jgi:flagellar basal-body rod protein FlgF
MEDSLVSVASALSVYERKLDVAARNLANARTPGYAASVVGVRSFSSELAASSGSGHVEAVERPVFGGGETIHSPNPLAVSISGEGFFEATSPDGPVYTRGGDFMDVDGVVSTRSGLPIVGQGGPIELKPGGGTPRIDREGRVFQGDREVGRLKIVAFDDVSRLTPVSETLAKAEDGAGPREAPDSFFVPGTLEISAVPVVQGLVDMIVVQRGFEGAQKASHVIHDAFERLLRSPV